MSYPWYDLITPPINRKALLLDGNIRFNTAASPPQAMFWYEPSYRISVPFPMDGNIHANINASAPIFASRIQTNRYFWTAWLSPDVEYIWGPWFGTVNSRDDLPVIIALNKTIDALLVYNVSGNPGDVKVYHRTERWPNRETNGTVDTTTSPPTVTLQPGQYALFWNTVKPTVNTSAPWGFTDYKPISATSEPPGGRFKLFHVDNATMYVVSDLNMGIILRMIRSTNTKFDRVKYNNTYQGLPGSALIFDATTRTCIADNIDTRPGPFLPIEVYDYDPCGGTWSSGYHVLKVSYIEDADGVMMVLRKLKTTTQPWNPRSTTIYAVKASRVDNVTTRYRAYVSIRAYTDITSYGAVNQVPHTGVLITGVQSGHEYFDGTSWNAATPVSGAWNYYQGYCAGALVKEDYTGSTYYYRACLRRENSYRVGSYPVVQVPSTTWGIGVQLNYDGSTIPSTRRIQFVMDVLVRTDGTAPAITTESPARADDTQPLFNWLWGYPWDISTSASVTGGTATISVTTNAPDGTPVYAVNVSTGNVVAQGTVSGGKAQLSFAAPTSTTTYRVYVQGTDIVPTF